MDWDAERVGLVGTACVYGMVCVCVWDVVRACMGCSACVYGMPEAVHAL